MKTLQNEIKNALQLILDPGEAYRQSMIIIGSMTEAESEGYEEMLKAGYTCELKAGNIVFNEPVPTFTIENLRQILCLPSDKFQDIMFYNNYRAEKEFSKKQADVGRWLCNLDNSEASRIWKYLTLGI